MKILGNECPIREVPAGDAGNTDVEMGEIRIRIAMPQDQRTATIWHEALHNVAWFLGFTLKHRYIDCIAQGVISIIRDNPELMREMFGQEKEK